VPLAVSSVPQLWPGYSGNVSVFWDTRAISGQRTISAIADSTGLVVESDETNNAASIQVNVRGNKLK